MIGDKCLGMCNAVAEVFPEAQCQRCTVLFSEPNLRKTIDSTYYTIKNCSIYSEATKWVEMSVNPTNEDEFVINSFSIGAGDCVCFFNNIHVSNCRRVFAILSNISI